MKKSIITAAIVLTTTVIASSGVKSSKSNEIKVQNISLSTSINGGKEIASAD